MSATTLKAILLAAFLAAIFLLVGTSDYDEAKRQEAWNCAKYPQAFSYCADVLARAGK